MAGKRHLSLLATTKPDLILLDIMMEPMDGWETLEKIKANPETGDLPVLMFSAKKITPEEAQEHCLSIEDFVSKPVILPSCSTRSTGFSNAARHVKTEASQAKDAGVDRRAHRRICCASERVLRWIKIFLRS